MWRPGPQGSIRQDYTNFQTEEKQTLEIVNLSRERNQLRKKKKYFLPRSRGLSVLRLGQRRALEGNRLRLISFTCFMRFESHRHYHHDFDSPWGEINGASSLAIPIMISSHHVRDHHDGDHQHNHRHHRSHLEVRLMAPAASRSPSWSLSLFMSRSASVSAMLSVSSWGEKY